jgi:hypothetical protein
MSELSVYKRGVYKDFVCSDICWGKYAQVLKGQYSDRPSNENDSFNARMLINRSSA